MQVIKAERIAYGTLWVFIIYATLHRSDRSNPFVTPFSLTPPLFPIRTFGISYYRIPNGESGADVHDRVSLFLESFRSTQSKSYPCHPTVVVIVTHGLLARLFVMRFMRLTVNEYEKWRNPRNGEVYCLEMMSERERIAEGKKRGGRQVHSYKMTIPPQYRDDENKKRDEERKSLAKKLSLRRQKTLDLSIAQMAKELEELGVGDLASVGVDGDPDGV